MWFSPVFESFNFLFTKGVNHLSTRFCVAASKNGYCYNVFPTESFFFPITNVDFVTAEHKSLVCLAGGNRHRGNGQSLSNYYFSFTFRKLSLSFFGSLGLLQKCVAILYDGFIIFI